MNALTKTEEALPVAVEQPPVTMMDIINRAIFDPAVSAEKVERLGNLALSFKAQEAKEAYARAMILMKPKLPVIDRKGKIIIHEKGKEKIDANIQQSTPYALWEDIDAAITPILAEHGFVLTFRTGAGAEGRITVTGILTHEMGHSEESTMPLPLDTSGSKNNVQAAGSSTSYGRRYTACMLLNIRTRGQDDDGVAGDTPGTVTDDQLQKIGDLIKMTKADTAAFCKYMGVEALPDIKTKDFEKAITALNLKEKALHPK
jgi:hypothetical protein